LDRILEKGIVIDAWVRVSLAGVELVTIEGRVVVASIQTYLERAAQLGPMTLAAAPSVLRITSARRHRLADRQPHGLLAS
jgi:hypothetical protein